MIKYLSLIHISSEMRGHTDEEKKDFDRKNSAVPSGASGNSGAGVISLYIRWTGRNGQKSGNVLDSLVWNRQIWKRLIYKSVLRLSLIHI